MKKILRNLNSAAKQAMGRPRFRRGRPMACFAAEAQGASPPNNIGRGRTLSAGAALWRPGFPAAGRACARPCRRFKSACQRAAPCRRTGFKPRPRESPGPNRAETGLKNKYGRRFNNSAGKRLFVGMVENRLWIMWIGRRISLKSARLGQKYERIYLWGCGYEFKS